MAGEFLKAVQVVSGQEVVYVGKRRLHPPGQRLVVRRAEQRVQPDEAVATALEPGHLAGQQFGLAPIPAVGYDQHHRATAQNPSRPAVIEGLDGVADAGAAGPVGHGPRHLGHSPVNAPVLQMPGDAGQPRGEQESLQLLAAHGHRVDEVQQHPGVAFHGAADVADQGQGTRLGFALPVGQVKHLAAVGQAAAHTAAQVKFAAVAPGQATGAPLPQVPLQIGHQRTGGGHLGRRVLGEIPLAQHLAGAEGALQVHHRLPLAGVLRIIALGRPVGRVLAVGRNAGRAVTPFLAHGAQIAHAAPVSRPTPEDLESLVEQFIVAAAMHQQSTRRQAEVVAVPADGHELSGPHQVQHIPGTHVQPEPAQHLPEHQQVGQDGAIADIRRRGVLVDADGGGHRAVAGTGVTSDVVVEMASSPISPLTYRTSTDARTS